MGAAPPPLYVLRGQNLLEATLVGLPDVIDFDPHGPQITFSQFVGVRYVGPGIAVASPKPASHQHGVSDLWKGFLGGRRSSQEKDLNCLDGRGSFGHDGTNGNNGRPSSVDSDNGAKARSDRHRRKPGKNELHNNGQPREKSFSSPGEKEETEVYTWELVWKEGRANGTLKRLKIVTTDAGYQLIQNKIDAWTSASRTSSAMNEAAQAALAACGGHIKENHSYESVADLDTSAKSNLGGATESTSSLEHESSHEMFSASVPEDKGPYSTALHVIDMQSISSQGKFQPRCDSSSSILKDGHVMAIASVLPARFHYYDWTLLYSTNRDGISLNTLYRKAQMNGPAILIVRDFHHHIFGCYASEEWKVATRSYGTGECFVFQLVPEMTAYKWTRANKMFMVSNVDMLAIGGGDHYSILINSDLLTGYSGSCETFGSPQLASSEEFDVLSIELWGFQ